MRQEDIWDVDTAQHYDTPGSGMFAPEVLGPAVDRLAQLAGFEPESRHADWIGSEFTAESPSHVSVYRLPRLP